MLTLDCVGAVYSGPITNSTIVMKYQDRKYVSRVENKEKLIRVIQEDIVVINKNKDPKKSRKI